MTLLESSHLSGWIGRTLVDETGDKIGRVEAIYFDDDTDEPAWIAVAMGILGTRQSFVPVRGATADGDRLRVPFSKDQVKDAPNMEADGHLNHQEEAELYRYYGMEYGSGHAGQSGRTEARGTVGHDTSGPSTDDAMTRSEEELRVEKDVRETGRARLRKWVDTETVTQKVPVAREEIRVEREPITEANAERAMRGPEMSDEEHEVTLYEDEVRVEKQAVPKERVRLTKDTVVEDEVVSEDVRRERIDIDHDTDH